MNQYSIMLYIVETMGCKMNGYLLEGDSIHVMA